MLHDRADLEVKFRRYQERVIPGHGARPESDMVIWMVGILPVTDAGEQPDPHHAAGPASAAFPAPVEHGRRHGFVPTISLDRGSAPGPRVLPGTGRNRRTIIFSISTSTTTEDATVTILIQWAGSMSVVSNRTCIQ